VEHVWRPPIVAAAALALLAVNVLVSLAPAGRSSNSGIRFPAHSSPSASLLNGALVLYLLLLRRTTEEAS